MQSHNKFTILSKTGVVGSRTRPFRVGSRVRLTHTGARATTVVIGSRKPTERRAFIAGSPVRAIEAVVARTESSALLLSLQFPLQEVLWRKE